jgi:acyl carrier protein
MSASSIDDIRELILELLSPKLGSAIVDDHTKLVGLGLIDSADLLDVIVSVEQETGLDFDPEGVDLEEGLTIGLLIAAFAPTLPRASGQHQNNTSEAPTPPRLTPSLTRAARGGPASGPGQS